MSRAGKAKPPTPGEAKPPKPPKPGESGERNRLRKAGFLYVRQSISLTYFTRYLVIVDQ
jgi:hypothetical protein